MNTNQKPIGYMNPEDVDSIVLNYPWTDKTVHSISSNKGTIPIYLAPDPWNTALNLFLTARAINEIFDKRSK